MTFFRFNPAMPELQNIMNNVFDRSPLYRSNNQPASNIFENENSFVVELAVPGFKKEDFKVELNNHQLTISAEVEKVNDDSRKIHRLEFRKESFSKTFTLSEKAVDESNIEANYDNGILSIKLAKREEVKPKPARMIEIA